MEWQLVRILVIFRVVHGIQISVALPAMAGKVTRPGLAVAVLVLVVAESAWFVRRVVRRRGYGGPVTALVELACAAIALLAFAFALPQGNRSDVVTPLLDLTTEQVTGVAIGSAIGGSRRVLIAGTATVAAAYAALIALGKPSALTSTAVLIGITGYAALACLIRWGSMFLLGLAEDLTRMSRQLREEEHRAALGIELHNHLGNALTKLLRLDPGDSAAVAQVQAAVTQARDRLCTFVSTGRFSAEVPLLRMLERQVALAESDGLAVTLVVPSALADAPPALSADRIDLLEAALRAVLINVPRNAGVSHAVLHAAVRPGSGRDPDPDPGAGDGSVELLIADEGRGFPPGVLSDGIENMRSLSVHRKVLREAGGDLAIGSAPGCTEVAITLPVSPLRPGAGTAPATGRAMLIREAS
jgi:signal transduction histidine kinase